ncbi:gamma-glutamylcyclotransferase [Stenotrophomonas maltophilia]|uniref:gamma-glutamylcyclotransferase n=1 Tax=Stenotrophomonas maltophilia TaxID=40324 RepID=UPI002E7922C0|nr:gamma-glutamylcyclotransferase [Stenotrophomonas maltophilia]
MNTLNRDDLSSGSYLDSFSGLPDGVCLSAEQLEESLDLMLAGRPLPDQGVWVFAYGSLIWNPTMEFTDRQQATLDGWERSFCLHLIAGRATVGRPGRMLSLEKGRAVEGVAYFLSGECARQDLLAIWTREMVLGAYLPLWLDVTLEDGRVVSALAFTANHDDAHWRDGSALSCVARAISCAEGPYGTNADYVRQLQRSLQHEGLTDSYVEQVFNALEGAKQSC